VTNDSLKNDLHHGVSWMEAIVLYESEETL